MRPVAGNKRLLVRELAGELVVYDLERHRAHCLNRTAAFVFQQSNGRTSVGEIARRLQAELKLPADEELVRLALERLDEARLLDHGPTQPAVSHGWTRRDVVRRVGLGLTFVLPAVTSIFVPTPAEAAVSCVASTSCASAPGKSCYIASPPLCDGSCTCQPGTCSTDCCDGTGQDCSF